MKNEAVVLAGIRPQAFQAAAPPKQHWCDQQQQEEEEEQAASSSFNKTGCGSALLVLESSASGSGAGSYLREALPALHRPCKFVFHCCLLTFRLCLVGLVFSWTVESKF